MRNFCIVFYKFKYYILICFFLRTVRTDCGEQGGGKRQSPIDINKQNCRPCPADNTELEFANYWDAQGKATITDTGHTAEVKIKCPENVPTMRGGPLNGDYELVQMHFHWGANDNEGSEHTINGRPFSMEAHFVHYKKGTSDESSSDDDLIQGGWSSDEDNEDQREDEDYGTQEGCSSDEDSKKRKGCSSDEDKNGCSSDEDRSDQKDGSCDEEESSSDDSNENTIAVLAFFFQVGCSKDNEQFQAFVENLCRVKKPKDTVEINVQDLLQVFQEKADCEDYFTYQGSLTTEPYTENVIWIVNPKPIMISHEQVCAFRKLKDTEDRNIKSNLRAVQPLNGRHMFYCSPQAERSSASQLGIHEVEHPSRSDADSTAMTSTLQSNGNPMITGIQKDYPAHEMCSLEDVKNYVQHSKYDRDRKNDPGELPLSTATCESCMSKISSDSQYTNIFCYLDGCHHVFCRPCSMQMKSKCKKCNQRFRTILHSKFTIFNQDVKRQMVKENKKLWQCGIRDYVFDSWRGFFVRNPSMTCVAPSIRRSESQTVAAGGPNRREGQ